MHSGEKSLSTAPSQEERNIAQYSFVNCTRRFPQFTPLPKILNKS